MITQLKKIIDSSLRKIYPYIQRSYTKKSKVVNTICLYHTLQHRSIIEMT